MDYCGSSKSVKQARTCFLKVKTLIQEEEPPSSYTEAREKMETFVESYMLREIGA